MFGNVAGIVTPIVIGYLVAQSGSFNGALVFVGANALLTVFSYLVIVKDIKRVELRRRAERGANYSARLSAAAARCGPALTSRSN